MPKIILFVFPAFLALNTPLFAGEGAKLFALHCAACHGRDAEGAGPMSEALTQTPPDLTGLSARNGDRFPAETVASQIDGRAATIAHGGPMPIYGWFFEGPEVRLDLQDGASMQTTAPIAAIIEWLEDRQKGM